MLKAFISDLDGTLIDTRERAVHAHVYSLRTLGYKVTPEQIRNCTYNFSSDSRDILNQLNISLSETDFIQYTMGFRDDFFANWQRSFVIPGAFEALKKTQLLTKHMRLITSRHAITQTKQEIYKFGLHKYFERIFTRGDLAQEEGKDRIPLFPFIPHRRRLIRLALQDVKSEGEVWVVGDSAGELEAAKTLGFVTIGVLTGFGTPDDLKPFANHILDSIAEIVQLI
jgi:phosphoglycolate phosphatase-like HAD superfamily hydrolase